MAYLVDPRTISIYDFSRGQAGTGSWSQVAKRVAPDAAADDYLGQFLAWDGTTLAAGSRTKDTATGIDAGCLYLNPPPVMPEPAVICPDNISAGALFGGPVRIDGDTMSTGDGPTKSLARCNLSCQE